MASKTDNGKRRSIAARGRIELIAPSASPEQAAAIVAALERFFRATAPAPQRSAEGSEGWRRAAMLEAIEREGEGDLPHPWINT